MKRAIFVIGLLLLTTAARAEPPAPTPCETQVAGLTHYVQIITGARTQAEAVEAEQAAEIEQLKQQIQTLKTAVPNPAPKKEIGK